MKEEEVILHAFNQGFIVAKENKKLLKVVLDGLIDGSPYVEFFKKGVEHALSLEKGLDRGNGFGL